MKRDDARTPLARAMGLGSAKSGVQSWWIERVSAIALIPLTVWFIAAVIAHSGADYRGFVAWLQSPMSSVLMTLLVAALFYHMALGLQVIIEDYVHSGVKFAALIAVRLACFALAVTGILATIRVAAGL